MQQILASATPGAKIFYLFLLLLTGLLAVGMLIGIAMGIGGANTDNTLWVIYLSTFLQAVFAFILPAYLLTAWTNSRPITYLKLTESGNMGKQALFGIAVFIVSYLFVAFLTQWNKDVEFPESMRGVEQWMRAMEDSAMETTDRLLAVKTISGLLANLFFIAVLAAVSEEIFFRGALQQYIKERLKNGHAAVWLSAFVFSAIHLQFYGFFPRLALGAILGYLFLYTRNLWIPILVHFINNAMVILVMYFGKDSDWIEDIENKPITPLFVALAIVSAWLTIRLFRKYIKQNKENQIDKIEANSQ